MSIEMTVESLERGIEALARLKDEQEVGKWILMSPSGDVWTGPPRKIIAALVGRVGIDVTLYPARPQDAARRMKRDPLAWDDTVRSIDLDNALKVLIDAIKGTVIEDDRWVWEIRARRAEPDGEARTVLRVEPIRVAVVQASLLEAA